MKSYSLYIILIISALFACQSERQEDLLFKSMSSAKTGISFQNDLPYTEEFNTYTYRNFYNGAGVAIGDINNDGLQDIYFTGNITENKLYLNKGNFQFEDISETAGVACPDVWSTGATMIDVNGDGWLDIYVCKAGKPGGENRHNELFINQKNNTFLEQSAAYGLDITGLAIQSAFFDYDRDGDLDCYLLQNSIRSVGGFDLQEGLRNIPDPEGNKLLRNDQGKFTDITTESGLYSSNIGYGLGITLSDFNQDTWPDIFISNDFFERDYLYLNNQDGTFSEVGDLAFLSMSMGSMGADAVDLDNDLKPDLFVTEMLPESHDRKKTKTQYETWNKYQSAMSNGYHHQYARNVLQRNVGDGKFLELGRMSGVAATDWSWSCLAQDFDNDGLKDLFITNGLYKDLLDKDYLNYFANDAIVIAQIKQGGEVLKPLIDSMPTSPIQNHLYKNLGNYQFKNIASSCGLDELSYSNGSAYADLDNDGDLDLIVNNVNMPSRVYQNFTDTSRYRSLTLRLTMTNQNTHALGSKVIAYSGNKQWMAENYNSRGFQSSSAADIFLGLGNVTLLDSVVIHWPSGRRSKLEEVQTNQILIIDEGAESNQSVELQDAMKRDFSNLGFAHEAVNVNLFNRERTLIEMPGFEGPAIAVADVNGDGQTDVFCGGGKGQASTLFLRNRDGKLEDSKLAFADHAKSEVCAAQFFDADQDGDLDLYVGHCGKTFTDYSPELDDVLYINDGTGDFSTALRLPFTQKIYTSDIAFKDVNADGLLDVLVAEGQKPSKYGIPGSLHLLINQGNKKWKHLTPEPLKDLGMLTSVKVDGDAVWLAGEWMPILKIENLNVDDWSTLQITELPQSRGIWKHLNLIDYDQDGDLDLLAGNVGLNNFYQSGMRFCVNDFDGNGISEQLYCERVGDAYYPIHDIDELWSQMPALKKKYVYYEKFSQASMREMFGDEAIDAAYTLELETTETMLYQNNAGNYVPIVLPREVQYSSVHASELKIDDGKAVLYLGGNNFKVKPQFGRYDASLGWELDVVDLSIKSLGVQGQIRDLHVIDDKLYIGRNGEETLIMQD